VLFRSAQKLQSSLAVEGELPEDGLDAYGDGGDDLLLAPARKSVPSRTTLASRSGRCSRGRSSWPGSPARGRARGATRLPRARFSSGRSSGRRGALSRVLASYGRGGHRRLRRCPPPRSIIGPSSCLTARGGGDGGCVQGSRWCQRRLAHPRELGASTSPSRSSPKGRHPWSIPPYSAGAAASISSPSASTLAAAGTEISMLSLAEAPSSAAAASVSVYVQTT